MKVDESDFQQHHIKPLTRWPRPSREHFRIVCTFAFRCREQLGIGLDHSLNQRIRESYDCRIVVNIVPYGRLQNSLQLTTSLVLVPVTGAYESPYNPVSSLSLHLHHRLQARYPTSNERKFIHRLFVHVVAFPT